MFSVDFYLHAHALPSGFLEKKAERNRVEAVKVGSEKDMTNTKNNAHF